MLKGVLLEAFKLLFSQGSMFLGWFEGDFGVVGSFREPGLQGSVAPLGPLGPGFTSLFWKKKKRMICLTHVAVFHATTGRYSELLWALRGSFGKKNTKTPQKATKLRLSLLDTLQK